MARPILEICKNGHALVEFGRDNQGTCRGCRSDYQRKDQQEKLKRLHMYKRKMGCKICGYNKSAYALDFHHRDPTEKEFTITTHLNYAWKRILAEVRKCDVLCRNCHAELHEQERLFSQ